MIANEHSHLASDKENIVKLIVWLSHNSGYTEKHWIALLYLSESIVWCEYNISIKLANKKWDTGSLGLVLGSLGAGLFVDLLWDDSPWLLVLGASQVKFGFQSLPDSPEETP